MTPTLWALAAVLLVLVVVLARAAVTIHRRWFVSPTLAPPTATQPGDLQILFVNGRPVWQRVVGEDDAPARLE